jgi:hypothetical protein
MAIKKENGLLLLLLAAGVFLAFRKPGKKVVITTDDPVPIPIDTNANFKVFVPSGTILFDMDKTTKKGITSGDQYFDGYNTGELPMWVKIKNGNEFDYVQSPNFKITTHQNLSNNPTRPQPGYLNPNIPQFADGPPITPTVGPTPGQQQPILITLPSQPGEPLTHAPIVAPGRTPQQNLQSNMNTLQFAPEGARLIQPRF